MKHILFPADLTRFVILAFATVSVTIFGIWNIQYDGQKNLWSQDNQNFETMILRAEAPISKEYHNSSQNENDEALVADKRLSQLFFRRSIVQLKAL